MTPHASLLTSPQQGTDAAGEGWVAELAPSPACTPCLVCGNAAEPGDDLCRGHGGMPDGIERHRLMREAC